MNEKEYIEGLRKELNNRVTLGADQIMSRIEKENDEPVRVIHHKKFHAGTPAAVACAVFALCITASAVYLNAGRKNDIQDFSSECHLYTTSSYTTSVPSVNNPSASTSFIPQNTVVSPTSDINSHKPAVTDTSDFTGSVSEAEKNAVVTDSDKRSETENSEMVSVTETGYSGMEEVITQGTEVTEGNEISEVSEITGGNESDNEVLPEGINILEKPVGCSIWEFGSIDDAILKKYGENAVIEKIEKHELEKVNAYVKLEQMAYVLTEDNNIHLIYAEHERIVTMKDGTYPPTQKIKEELNSQLNYFGQLSEDKNKYTIAFSSDSPANDILLNDENVVSIEETTLIREECDSPLGINRCVNFSYITGKTKEEFYEEYKDSLHLVYPQQHPVNGYILDGFCGIIDDSHETYEALKKLFESDVDFFIGPESEPDDEFQPDLLKEYNRLFGETEQDVSLNAQLLLNSFNNQTPDSDIGDLNTDGSIDLTDLSELALAVIGEIELTDSQKSAADINGDGEVNLSDLARLKQFVSNSITSLR